MKKMLFFSAFAAAAVLAASYRDITTVEHSGAGSLYVTNTGTTAYSISAVLVKIPAVSTGTYSFVVNRGLTNSVTVFSNASTNNTSLVYLPESHVFVAIGDSYTSTWTGASNISVLVHTEVNK